MNEHENKAYVVTSGSYSDYRIEAVFSTREKAEEYLQYNDDEYRVEEYELDKVFEKEESLWRILIGLSEDNVRVSKYEYDDEDENHKVNSMGLFKSLGRNKQFVFETWVKTETKDRAIKIARERLVAARTNEIIWLRLQIPDDEGHYPLYNCYTNERIKNG